jgi:hypothetical protein
MPRPGSFGPRLLLVVPLVALLAAQGLFRKAIKELPMQAIAADLGMASTSPQCQPTTHTKEKDLDRFEHTLHTSFTRFTGRDHR